MAPINLLFSLLSSSFLLSSLSPPSSALPDRTLLQFNPAPRNIETFFPSNSFPAFPSSPSPPLLPPSPNPSPPRSNSPPPPPPPQKSTSVTKAVVGTAFGSFAASALLFFLFYKFSVKRRRYVQDAGGADSKNPYAKNPYFQSSPQWKTGYAGGGGGRRDEDVKGMIVDENGLDVVYLRKLEEGGRAALCSYCKLALNCDDDDREEEVVRDRRKGRRRRVHESPLLPTGSVRSSDSAPATLAAFALSRHELPPSPPVPPLPLPPGRQSSPPPVPPLPVPPGRQSADSAPSPPPAPAPPAPPKAPSPPPPPPPPQKGPAAPPPPPPPRPPSGPPPPPPGRPSPASSSLRPPPMPMGSPGDSSGGPTRRAPLPPPAKLKPLHWDKVTTANAEHSMVWDKIHDGSFQFDDELMVALFGTVAARKPNGPNKANTSDASGAASQICILDPRKSQNMAIVLRSLAVGRQEILDSFLDGHGLSADTLEKLSQVAPTKDEEAQVLQFSGDPSKLADAESFLYHLLRAVPSPYARLDAMLFKANYDHEILHIKESLQVLETACKEIRGRGLFLKLLEAILKAGNRMNAGTARGNAQAFNLTTLRKLSDVKSTDGNTTLLHFVVEEVVRSEGKRCVLNRNQSFGRSSSTRSISSDKPSSAAKEEKEREYMMLGLPVVGGLSVDFATVKKAALIDHDALVSSCSSLQTRTRELRQFLRSCNDADGGGKFVKEMTVFLEAAAAELNVVVGDEKERVMDLVMRTTEYYQVGASKDKSWQPLQIFVIVKDFLGMVDQVCVDIARNQQQRQQRKKRQQASLAAAASASVTGSPSSSGRMSPVTSGRMSPARFPNLPKHFMSDHYRTSSGSGSDSEDDDFS